MDRIRIRGGTAYAALWLTLLPGSFGRRKDRLSLLAVSLLAGVMVALLELMMANVRLDNAPRIAMTITVTHKSVFKGQYGRNLPQDWHWNLGLEPLPGMTHESMLRVSPAVWERVQPGQRMRLLVHPGRLGWVWYSRAEMDEKGFAEVVR